jgi:hypothetical protein
VIAIPYTQILVLIAFAVFFHRAAEMEDDSTPWIWCAVSILVSLVTLFWLHWGWLGIILSQVGIFIGITVIKLAREK